MVSDALGAKSNVSARLGLDERHCRLAMIKLQQLRKAYKKLYGVALSSLDHYKADTSTLVLFRQLLLETHLTNRAVLENPMETAQRSQANGEPYAPVYRYACPDANGQVIDDELRLDSSSYVDGVPPYYVAFSTIRETPPTNGQRMLYLEHVTSIPKSVVDQFWAARCTRGPR